MAGFTTLTGTIKDPFGTPYANGTWTANFVDPGTPGKTPLINGSIITRVYAGDLDGFGVFTVSLPDNAVIASQTGAVGTQWSFTFVNKSSPVGLGAPPGFTLAALTVTGATQDISAAAQAASASITIPTAPLLAGNQTWTGNNTFSTGTTTINNPVITGTDSGVETLQNKALTGASSGNNVTLLNYQTAKAAITGTGSDAALFSYTLPANTVATGKGIRITCGFNHSTGTASVTYKVKVNGSAVIAPASAVTGAGCIKAVCMAASSTGVDIPDASLAIASTIYTEAVTSSTGAGMAWTSSQTIEVDFNVAATDQVTPGSFVVELIQ